MSASLEEMLVSEAGLARDKLEAAKAKSAADKISLLYAIEQVEPNVAPKALEVMSKFHGIQIAQLQEMDIPPQIVKLIPKDLANKLRIIPIDRAGNNIIIATSDPKNPAILDNIRRKTGYSVKPVLASEMRISEALQKYYPSGMDMESFNKEDYTNLKKKTDNIRFDISRDQAGAKDGPIIGLVNEILIQCMERKASDIHMEPYETSMRIRLRIDGALVELARPPVEIKDSLTTRIKIMAGMNIAEKRLPQDGGIRVQIGDKPVDFRVNSLPTLFGEKIVMRILDKSSLQVDMTQLGFEREELDRFMDALHRPFGMVLVTGPTGSGKTTTLYSALSELNKVTENIMTAEDPVEFNLAGINQVQMKPDIGLTFAAALRAFLRQDPDVIMVGEIRDLETAEISIKAALTGHMVLSTLHTNSASDTIVRLQNMGVESFNLVSALNAVVAQRLARRICAKCRVVDSTVTPEALIELGIHPSYSTKVHAYKGQGCPACSNTGYKGRVAVHEVMLLTDPIREAILKGQPAMEIKRVAMAAGMKTLRQAALNKMVQGVTSAQEVVKVTASDTAKGAQLAA